MKRVLASHLLATGLIAATLALGGCAGFQPLYAQPEVMKGLTSIAVRAPDGRTGYLMRQHLDDAFAKNHRMGQQLMGLKRLSDLPELRVRASEVLAGLDAGTI